MKVAFITRSTLYTVFGGDTVQILETAKHLGQLGHQVAIFRSNETIPYDEFDLLHFFNLIRPADILYHIKRSHTPFVITPILVDYTEYDKKYRKGFSGWLLRRFSSGEYLKAVSRWILLKDTLPAKEYLWKGHSRSIRQILEKVKMILPNSIAEYEALESRYQVRKPYQVVPNGIDEKLFFRDETMPKDETLVVCAARIEGIKNQINLIKALSNTQFTLVLIGEAGANQKTYYKECRKEASKNIIFTGGLSQQEVAQYYKKAKVHVLASWFETCGLSSLEAAATGCNIVITDKGYTREYFGNQAFYCNPEDLTSIYNAVALASKAAHADGLPETILKKFTWKESAKKTMEAYEKVLSEN
jgi:glycosyltransferase involved in cell wall biosynthesis